MKKYLLDTAPLAGLLHRRPASILLIQPWIVNQEVATSSLVYGEIIEYIKGRDEYERERADLRALLRAVYLYPLSFSILERYADIRRQLRPPYGPGLETSIR